MTGYLQELTVQQLLNVLKAAKELELQESFIELIQKELERRGFNTYNKE